MSSNLDDLPFPGHSSAIYTEASELPPFSVTDAKKFRTSSLSSPFCTETIALRRFQAQTAASSAQKMGLLELARKMPASSTACLPSLSPLLFSYFIASSAGLQSRAGPFAPLSARARDAKAKEWKQTSKQWQSRSLSIVMKAVENQDKVLQEEYNDNRILQYCNIDKKKDKRTLGELEADFLEALQSFYYDNKPIMSNDEFDNLKEELLWEGSSVVILSSDEQRFMEASLSYAAGRPNITDAEYDALKSKLKKAGSKVAIEGPRCSLRSKKVYSDSTVDYFKMLLLNVPAALISLALVFFLDDLTGFEITYLLELPEPYSFVFTWFVVLPITFFIAQFLTNIILKDFIILKGPCPNCGNYTNSFFGTILTVPSEGDSNIVKCEKCNSILKFELNTRLVTLESTATDKGKGKAPRKVAANAE